MLVALVLLMHDLGCVYILIWSTSGEKGVGVSSLAVCMACMLTKNCALTDTHNRLRSRKSTATVATCFLSGASSFARSSDEKSHLRLSHVTYGDYRSWKPPVHYQWPATQPHMLAINSLAKLHDAETRSDMLQYLRATRLTPLVSICCTTCSTTSCTTNLQQDHTKFYGESPYWIDGPQQIHSIPTCQYVVRLVVQQIY